MHVFYGSILMSATISYITLKVMGCRWQQFTHQPFAPFRSIIACNCAYTSPLYNLRPLTQPADARIISDFSYFRKYFPRSVIHLHSATLISSQRQNYIITLKSILTQGRALVPLHFISSFPQSIIARNGSILAPLIKSIRVRYLTPMENSRFSISKRSIRGFQCLRV